ncbi:MAG: membrane protein insertion efficiency factor YidD [Desulfobacterales bacterium]|nr:membrane protein insertion efficiency factor YidD [Desulfobacterales bacterium]MDD4392416.1 membrane protein insertion efficiency factor YidD [Desulfobacterales bacterium]
MKRISIYCVAAVWVCSLLISPVPVAADDRQREMGLTVMADMAAGTLRSSERSLPVVLKPVQWFSTYISRADGDRCAMYPTCSQYAMESVKRHGMFMGWIMTCDRLMRCGRDELRRSPLVEVNGRTRCYDPVEQNDFWWK